MASQPLLTSRIDTTKPLSPKKKKENLLLTLPLEVRAMIYEHVLNTGTFDEETQSHVYEIKVRWAQRYQNTHLRQNNYTLDNIRHNHFALLRTCWDVYEEIQDLVNLKATFSFSSPWSFAKFACGPLADPFFSTDDADVGLYGEHTLRAARRLSAGNLCVLNDAEGTEITYTGGRDIGNGYQILGRALMSVKDNSQLI
jgi:hypothetical protein